MFETIYLAECSATYRDLIPRLLNGYTRNIIDLWEEPQTILDPYRTDHLLIVDELFLTRGPGPASVRIATWFEPRAIILIPRLLLRRRERILRDLPHGILELRRPFESSELEKAFKNLGMEHRIFPPAPGEIMSEKPESIFSLTDEEKQKNIQDHLNVILPKEFVEGIVREMIKAQVENLVPILAEKMIQDEIQRLTE